MWLLIPILLYAVAFLSVRHVYSHWRRKGFPHERSDLTWAFLKKCYKREFHSVEAICEAYRCGKERFVGIYFLFHPTLLVRDLPLARDIIENTFGHFSHAEWNYVRGYRKLNIIEKISPIFSAARLEAIFGIIEKVGEAAVTHLNITVCSSDRNSLTEIDMQHLFRTYAMSIIANVIYGLEIDLFKKTDSVFQQYLNYSVCPPALHSYTYNRIRKKLSLTYRLSDVIRENVEQREEGGMIRKDILQVLVKFRNGNDIEEREKFNWQIENLFDKEKLLSIHRLSHITEHLLENEMPTISSIAVFALYEILQQPDLKAEILGEIRNHLKVDTTEPRLNYEDFKHLKLMDLCIQETVRKYPSVAVVEYVCRRHFQIPDCKHTLHEGESFMIPLLAMQRDEKYFESPLSFKPGRFLHDSSSSNSLGLISKTSVAQKFVMLVVKCILVKLFLKFHMQPVQADNIEVCYNGTPFIKSKQGFRVLIQSRK